MNRVIAAAGIVWLGLSTLAWGQPAFPGKSIRIITLTAAGGTLDLVARSVGQKLSEQMGQSALVENRLGAGGNVGADAVAKAAPDGYTIGMNTVSTHGINPTLYGAAMPFDAIRDFSPITLVAESKNVVVVHPSIPVNGAQDLARYAHANPNKLSFGSAGSGTSQHLAGELFKMQTSTIMQHIPYKGAAQAIPDLLSGQIHLMFVGIPEALPHIRSGKLRALGVTTRERSSVIPDVVPIAEQGFPEFDVRAWFGMVAPAGVPREIVSRYHTEIIKAIGSKEVSARFASVGLDPVTSSSPDQFANFIRLEIAKWAPVVKASGAKAD
ncbi:MAG: tripartite tricarboxylate transporter substrate binding protein [Betaproteobacteria bacterium]|nr:tripartite tricarboxylate transporter substrate binding protein [Betaproteobacteria bacterium]